MIQVSNLTRYYGEFAALQDVSFEIREGEVVGLLGLNGAGKTTTLQILAGLLPTSGGDVTVDGIDLVAASDELRQRIGFLPEDPPLYRDMTVEGFLRHMGRLRGMSQEALTRRMPDILELAQLKGKEQQVIATLSHGFRKRVGIAQSVIHDPRLVLLDEPISGLDPVQIVEMRSVVRRLGEGRMVLISSHNLPEISQTCDRILVLRDGRLVAQGTEEQLARRLGDARIVLTVRGEQAALEKWLQEHPKVERMDPRPVSGLYASAVVDLEGDVREELIRDLIGAGFGVRLIEVPDDELEEIFLGLTRDDLQEEVRP
ncbi:MAG: ABC transporter ATP-binding protein [Deltaproteobacteria bacterium]|nr:ABC transporter ATP-binding protein [Deltaproteobacteria bacterium]MBW2253792.1 ABC transporter ATP-binding protein [Deltaproteobacteria bacterium]